MLNLTFAGNIGQDAVLKESNGSCFVSFTVAVNKRYKNKDGVTVESVTWVSCITRQETLLPWLKSGTQVLVLGELSLNTYKNKDGNWVAGVNCSCDKIQLLSSSKKDGAAGSGSTSEAPDLNDAPPAVPPGGDLPF